MSHLDYPVSLRLEGRAVLVVGDGEVAAARAAGLLAAGARVTVCTPAPGPALEALEGELVLVRRAAGAAELDGAKLVFLALEDAAASAQLAAEARTRGLLVNAADLPELCDFTLPAVARRGVVTLAVSTAGRAPAVARRLRTLLIEALPARHVELVRLVTHLRRRLRPGPARMRFVRGVIDGEIGRALLNGERRAAFVALRAELRRHEEEHRS